MTINSRAAFQAYTMIGSEATYGTAVTANKNVGLVQSFSLNENNKLIEVNQVGDRAVAEYLPGVYEVKGDMEVAYQNARLLGLLIGTTVHTNTVADVIHVLATNNSDLTSFTAEFGFNGATQQKYLVTGVKLDEGTLSCDTEGFLKLVVSFTGQTNSAIGSIQAYTTSSLPAFAPYSSNLSAGASGATRIAGLQSFNMKVGNSEAPVSEVGSRTIQDLKHGGRKMIGDFSMAFQDETEHAKFLGGASTPQNTLSTQTFTFQVLKDTTALGSGKRGLQFQLTGVSYSTSKNAVPVDGVLMQDFSYVATAVTNFSAWDNNSAAGWL